MTKTIYLVIFTIALILSSCAAGHHAFKLETTYYDNSNLHDRVSFSYKNDILFDTGNKKNFKKEEGKNLNIVSVKITNHTDSIITIGENYKFYSNNNEIFPISSAIIFNKIKQHAWSHIFYLLLTPLNLTITKDYSTTQYRFGIVLGPSLAITNATIASIANKELRNELNTYYILGTSILPGETAHGIVGFKTPPYIPISLRKE